MRRALDHDVRLAYLADPMTADNFDFDQLGGRGGVVIPAGKASVPVEVRLISDRAQESDEQFALRLLGAVDENQQQPTGVATIVDDDHCCSGNLSISDARIVEGNGGSRTLYLKVTLAEKVPHEVTFDFATTDGTAVGPGDYQPTSGTRRIPKSGRNQAVIAAKITGDRLAESDESLTVVISNVVGTTVEKAIGTVTVVDDD
jgi:hypothetical protein